MRPHSILVYTNDLNESVDFYRSVLGTDPVGGEDGHFSVFQLEGFSFIVHSNPNLAYKQDPAAIAAARENLPPPVLEISGDPEEVYNRIAASRFPTPSPPTDRWHGLHQLNLRDPAGNELAVVRPVRQR